MIHVLLVDDAPLALIGLKNILAIRKDEISIVGEAGNQNETMNFLKICPVKPDVILLDISLEKEADGIDIAQEVSVKYPDIAVIVFSHHKNIEYMIGAFRAKAYGYLSKDSSVEDILNAVLSANTREGLYLGETISRKDMISAFENLRSVKAMNVFRLSDREVEIIQLLAQGYSTKLIANELNITNSTVETHKDNIKLKTSRKTIIEVIVSAIQTKLIDLNKL